MALSGQRFHSESGPRESTINSSFPPLYKVDFVYLTICGTYSLSGDGCCFTADLSLKHLHLIVLSRLIYMKCSNLVSRALWTVEYRPCWLCCSPQLLCPMPGKTLLQTKCCYSRDTVVNNMTFISACQWLQLVSLICISSCGSTFVGRKTWKLLVLVV